MRILFLVFLHLVPIGALACSVPLQSTYLSHIQLVEKSNLIVLVKLKGMTKANGRVVYELSTVKSLKGSPKQSYLIQRRGPATGYERLDFDGHASDAFWRKDGLGRGGWLPGLCSPNFDFSYGVEYLLFPEMLCNGSAAEAILSDDDRWLKFVIEKLDSN